MPQCKHRYPVRLRGLAVLALIAATAQPAAADTSATEPALVPVKLVVDNNRVGGAMLYLAVYSAEGGEGSWQQEHHRAVRFELPAAGTAEFTLDLAAGRYAMRAFVDTNGNGKLDTRRFNRPAEPFAISMPAGRDKPSVHFHNAVVAVDADSPSVRLTLIYPEELANTEDVSTGFE